MLYLNACDLVDGLSSDRSWGFSSSDRFVVAFLLEGFRGVVSLGLSDRLTGVGLTDVNSELIVTTDVSASDDSSITTDVYRSILTDEASELITDGFLSCSNEKVLSCGIVI